MDLASGSRIGPYEIVAPIGAGGMGEVYRARDPRLGREVAVKILPAAFAADGDRLRRFEQEARAAGRLNHPALLTVFDVGLQEQQPYLVTELLEGETLRERLDRAPLPADRCREIAAEVAEGLAAAHDGGVVHRDLKPANLFLTQGGRVKILDFGLAKSQPGDFGADWRDAPTQAADTAAGVVFGTLAYLSPEQLRSQPAGPSSDLFALGVILYEMLTGRRPFDGDSAPEVMSAILHQDPGAPSRVTASVPPTLDRVVRRCLEKDPSRRFRSAHDLAFQLRELQDSAPPLARPPLRRRPRGIDSVAVLPFVNQGGDPETEYLSDGITESILHALSQLPKLRVMARSTVFRFKAPDIDPRAVGRELGVRAVLTGRLVQRGESLAIEAELVDVENGSRLWGERFNRRPSDLLAVQDEIAREISHGLRLKLTGADRRRLAKSYTRDTAAYQAYLKGRFYWNKWTPDGMRVAIEFYEQAIASDPNYALAYAGLADSHGVLGSIKAVAPAEAFPRAKAAALKALELDPNLAEAHTSLGFIRRFFDWDWADAERSFERAASLNPNYATAHRWYGMFLSGMARHEDAIREVNLALALDPLSMIIHTSVGDVLFYARRYEEAIACYRRAIELDPTLLPAHSDLARALEHSGRIEEAIAEYERAIGMVTDVSADPSIGLANAYAVAGRRADALAVLDRLQELRTRRYVSPWGLASIYARMGEETAALDWLDMAYDQHDSTLVWAKVHPRFDTLREHPRFQQLLRRMGLD